MSAYYRVIERRKGEGVFAEGSWHAKVEIRGVQYAVSLVQGKRVRLAYSAKFGYRWDAFVRDAQGKTLYDGAVTKATGLVWILETAGLIPFRPGRRADVEQTLNHVRQDVEHWKRRAAEDRTAGRKLLGGPTTAMEYERDYIERLKILEEGIAYDNELRARFPQ